ncbi:MAG: hypothetical protein F6K40_17620 [Okeania sp. SIO3I5]|uniref:hypothetical protein n=1 Tax=Okeania sp. SIO3I5 TaxID=2607805 RepID=UPI0013B99ED9|nr:hypothetical protein [Okeania sp. SIO3I5]NEQ37984.1 hypothetical protein [Okeania sp. SIO3I5]
MLSLISCPVVSVLYREAKEEVGANGRSPLQEKEKPYMTVNISPIFTQTIPTDMI